MLAELRYSARGLARTPALTAALLLTIALGIGGNAMVSGFIRGSLQRRVAVPEPDRAVSVFSRDALGGFVALSPSEFARVKAATPSFATLGAMRESKAEVRFDGRASLVSVGDVTPELLSVLNVSATSGIIVSRRLWRVEFGAPGRFVGQTLTIDGRPLPIAGFMPEEFSGLYNGRDIGVWTPLDESSLGDPNRQGHTLWTVGRLRAGATAAQAQAEITAAFGGDGRVIAVPYTGIEPDVAGGLARIGTALPLAALGVFFVACANGASFLLSRATSRAHETSVRIAIGADRRHIARQLLMDAGLIAIAGTAAGSSSRTSNRGTSPQTMVMAAHTAQAAAMAGTFGEKLSSVAS
jgi:hypothetical protein